MKLFPPRWPFIWALGLLAALLFGQIGYDENNKPRPPIIYLHDGDAGWAFSINGTREPWEVERVRVDPAFVASGFKVHIVTTADGTVFMSFDGRKL